MIRRSLYAAIASFVIIANPCAAQRKAEQGTQMAFYGGKLWVRDASASVGIFQLEVGPTPHPGAALTWRGLGCITVGRGLGFGPIELGGVVRAPGLLGRLVVPYAAGAFVGWGLYAGVSARAGLEFTRAPLRFEGRAYHDLTVGDSPNAPAYELLVGFAVP